MLRPITSTGSFSRHHRPTVFRPTLNPTSRESGGWYRRKRLAHIYTPYDFVPSQSSQPTHAQTITPCISSSCSWYSECFLFINDFQLSIAVANRGSRHLKGWWPLPDTASKSHLPQCLCAQGSYWQGLLPLVEFLYLLWVGVLTLLFQMVVNTAQPYDDKGQAKSQPRRKEKRSHGSKTKMKMATLTTTMTSEVV